jgi:murein L,D-transpeptidase YafK
MIVRWNFIHKDKDSYQEKIPAEMIFVGKYYKHIIFIDVVENRMYIFENKNYKLSLIQNHYVSIGKNGYIKTKEGDKKTPLGVYFINGVVTKKTINPKRFGNSDALSLNYPNPIDKINKRTGHGIWIHGTPDKSLFRQPLASNGCISLETSSMQSIVDKMKGETIPVIISNNISWIDKKEFAKERANFFSILLNWKRAWESLSFEKYIDFYDKSFLNKNYNFRSWSAHKKKVIERSKYVEVNLHKILILYDRFNKVLLTSFEQDFSSDTYKSRNYKYLYWKLNKFNLWRVISEVTSKNIPTT